MSTSTTKPPTDRPALAEWYRVSERTLYRWERAGVEITSPIEVARYLVTSKNAKPDTLETVLNELENELEP